MNNILLAFIFGIFTSLLLFYFIIGCTAVWMEDEISKFTKTDKIKFKLRIFIFLFWPAVIKDIYTKFHDA